MLKNIFLTFPKMDRKIKKIPGSDILISGIILFLVYIFFVWKNPNFFYDSLGFIIDSLEWIGLKLEEFGFDNYYYCLAWYVIFFTCNSKVNIIRNSLLIPFLLSCGKYFKDITLKKTEFPTSVQNIEYVKNEDVPRLNFQNEKISINT